MRLILGDRRGSKPFQDAQNTYQIKQVGDPVTLGALGPRTDDTAGKPAYLATVPVVPGDNLQDLIDKYAQGFEPGTADGRFGLVIGVNKFARPGTGSAVEAEIQRAIDQVRDSHPPFPVTVIGFTWANSRIGPQDSPGQDTIPYAAIRETIVRHPDAEALLTDLRDQADGNPTFLHTGDADVASMTGLFNRADTAISGRPDVQIISGGYTFDSAPAPAARANQRDQQVRRAMAEVDPRSVYMPEPNTFLRVDHAGLERDITFGVRDDPQGELKYTSKEGRGLGQSVAQQRLFQGMDPRGFGAFDPDVAVETQAERLLQNYDPANPDGVPQSHADSETWRKQVQNYIQTFFPGIDANQADGLTRLAFHSVTPVSPTSQRAILSQLTGDGSKTLVDVARATNKALKDNPQTSSQAPPVSTVVDAPATTTRATPTDEFTAAKATAEPARLRTERFNPSKDTVVPGTSLLRGEITTIDFTTRDFTTDGVDHRSFDVHLDLVSRDNQMSDQQLRDFADTVQSTIDQAVNNRYTLPDGKQLHVNLIVDTPPWRDGMMTDWADDPTRNPPVEVTSDPGADTDQHQWNTNGPAALKVHEVMHYLGAKEGYHADHHLFTTTDRPGVMGPEAATATGPAEYLTDQDLTTIHDVAQTAGPVRQQARPEQNQPSAQKPSPHTPSQAPKPVRVEGGRNAKFDEMARPAPAIGPDNYRQVTTDLKDAKKPIGFVVNSMLPATDIDRIPDVVRSITEGLDPGTKVAFVFGVNTTADTASETFRDDIARATRIAQDLDVPVAVNGYAVGTKNGKFPYGRTRNQVLRDPDTVAVIQGLARDGAYPYVSIQDFDQGARTLVDGTHVFDRIDTATRFDDAQSEPPARPMMISGGYRVGDAQDLVDRTRERLEQRARGHEAAIDGLRARDDADSRTDLAVEQKKLDAVRAGLGKLSTPPGREQFVRDFTTAVDEDMRSRDRQAGIHAMLPYSPEPNLFVDGLLTLGRPDVRFGDAGAEFLLLSETLHAAYGQELADSPDVLVDSQNNRHPDRDLAFMTDFVGSATPTDVSRLAADFAASNFLPQSHAVPTTVNRQLFNTEGTGFKEYKTDLRDPRIAAATPFAAPTDGGPSAWQQSLSPQQLQQLGAQPHNQLVPAISLPGPGNDGTARIGVPDSQRLVAAHLVATSNDSGTIQQQFAAAAAMAERGGLSLHPDSLYQAIAAARPGSDPNALRADTLRAGRDRISLDTAVGLRQAGPYDSADFFKAALAPDVARAHRRTEPLSTDPQELQARQDRIGNAHTVVELAAASGTQVQLIVHGGSGHPPVEHPVRGARPLGRLELLRTVDPQGHVAYAPYVAPPVSPTVDSDDESSDGGFDLFDQESAAGQEPDHEQEQEPQPEPNQEQEQELPSPDAVREALPTYLRDSRTLGIAEQLRATDGAALDETLRTLDPRLPDDLIASVQRDSRDDIDQFLGAGRPYATTVGGRPAELRVTAVLDWDAVAVDRRRDDPGKVATKTQESLTHTLRHNRDHHVEPRATVTAVPGFIASVGGSVPTAPATEHSTAHRTKYTSTTTVKVADLAEVTVPIRFVAQLTELGRPPSATAGVTGTVALGVPTKLTDPGDAAPARALTAPVPARFGVESVRNRPVEGGATFFDQVASMLTDQGLGDLVRVGAPGRPAVQQLLSEAGFSGGLAKMVVTDPANRHDGWVRSGSLPRAAEKGWRRFFPDRSQQVEVRLVALGLDEVESVDEATHLDTAALAGESTDSNTAKRLWNLWGSAGGGTDIAPLSLFIAPRLGGTSERGFTQAIAERTGAKQTVQATAPGVRYRGRYAVQVRVLGRPPTTLAGSVETFQWTTRDRLRDTVLDPDRSPGAWHGRQGEDRTHFAPDRIERGESFGGAFLTRVGDGGLADAVAEAVRSVPGRGKFRLPTHDELLRHFDEEDLAAGLSPEVQAALGRDADLRTQLSGDQLRHLADRIMQPGLRIPLIRTGTFHDYTTVVTIRGALGNLSDGDLVDRDKVEATDKKRSRSTVTTTRDTSRSAELSLEARVLGPIGRAASTLLGGPRAQIGWGTTDENAITGGQAAETGHGPALDDDGKPSGVRLREFAGTLDLTVTTRSSVRVNQAGRQLSIGSPGRGLPTVIGSIGTAPRTHRLDVRMLVPESKVSPTRPDPRPGPMPRDQETIEHPLPLGRMTGGYPHDLDGRRVESFAGAEALQDAVLDTLDDAGQDGIWTFAGGPVATVVADELSPERLTGDAELFSRPLTLSNLWHGRRAADAGADVRVRLRPTNPTVLDDADFGRLKQTFASGSGSRTKHGRTIELSASATATAGVSGRPEDHGGSTGTPGGAVTLSITPWRRVWGRVREQSLSGVAKLRVSGRPERELLVRVDVEAEVVAEARHDPNLLPPGLWPAAPTRRAGRRLTLPGAVIMRMTPAELQRMIDRDRARQQQTADVRLQLRHAERSEALRAEQHEQRTRVAEEQMRERGDLLRRQHAEARNTRRYVDRVQADRATSDAERLLVVDAAAGQAARHRQELDELTTAHADAGHQLRTAQEQQRTVLAEHQQRERDIVRADQQRRTEAAAAPPAPAHAAQPEFRPGPQRSFGIGGVATPVDLGDRIPHLRRALATAGSEELAQAILPVELGHSPYDNVRGLAGSSFAGAAHLHLASALNGGRSETVRLERRFKGHTYQVTMTAEPVGEARFAGVDLVDELSVTDRSTIAEADTRSTARTVGSVSLTARAQGTGTDQVEGNATDTTGPGPAGGTVGAGATATANLGNRGSKQTSSTGRTYEQSLTVTGPVATYRGPVRFTLTVTGAGLPPAGVSVQDIREITSYAATEGRPPARSGPVTAVPADETTDAARTDWREADGFDRLGQPGRFAVEDVLVDLADLHAAARQALAASGAPTGDHDPELGAALRAGLTVTAVKALPAMADGSFRVPVPTALDRDLFLDVRLVARPRTLSVDAGVKIGGSVERTRDTKFEQTAGHSFVVKATAPVVTGGVNHPGGASKVGERHDFNAVTATTYAEQQLYRTDPGAVVKDDGKIESGKGKQKPAERLDPDEKLTRALEYGVEFRFVARSRDGKHRGGSEIRVPGGLVIRMDDGAARAVTGQDVPPPVRATALAVAGRATEWSAAAARLDGLTTAADPDPQAVADAERALDDAENAWWTAFRAHAAGPVPAEVPPAEVATRTAETPTAGDPVDLTSGRVIYTETDLRLPGLTLERTHRSDYRWGRSFGPSWASTVDQRIVTGDGQAWFLAADGSIHTYPLPAEGDRADPVAGRGGPLRRLPGGGWLLAEREAQLLFAPADDGGDSWLSDVSAPDGHWQVDRAADGTPQRLRSAAGAEVELDTADGLVVGGRVVDGEVVLELPGFRYDDRRNPVGVRNFSGEETRLSYDDAARLVRWVDRNDEWYTYAYDTAGRCTATDGSGGYLRYTFAYGDGGTLVTNSLGQVTRYDIDERRRVTAVTDPLGAVTRFEWDAADRLLALTDPLGRVIRPTGDGRPAPAVPEFDRSGNRFYDGEGNLVEVIDPGGRAVKLEYGPFDLPIARIDEVGNRTEFAYDTELRLTTVTNPAGQVWRYAYDPAGRLSGQTDFDGRTQLYVHDDAGQLVAHTDAGGTTTRYGYDEAGRVVERQVGPSRTRLSYDAAGRVTGVVNPDAEVLFERDDEGRVVAETINGRTVRTSYLESGAVGTRTTPSGRLSRWTYDADGRPAGLAAGAHQLRFSHDAAGREISRTLGDLVALRQSFDPAGRLSGQDIAGVAERGFAYDTADRITAITDSVAGDRRFDADDTGRIRAVTGAGPQTYAYDEAGNLVGAGGGRWEFDGTMLVRSDDATFDYDEKGRLTGRTDAAGGWRFGWDGEDRMVEAVTPGGDRWHYRYDGFGRRIAKQRLGDGGEVLEEVAFAWSGDLMLEQSHRHADGTATTSWDYRPDSSAPVAQTDDGALRAIVTDVIGTPTHLVEPDGALRWWSRGDLWGRGGDAAATPLRFPGQYFDAETGLHYNRFRYYDPATARYVSPDPLGLSGGPNPTAYVPDPLTVADPLGLTSCKVDRPAVNPLATTEVTPAGQPSALPATVGPPAPDALYGMAQWQSIDIRNPDGSTTREWVLRDTPSPPPSTTPARQMASQAHTWYSDVGYAPATALRDPASSASQSYDSVRTQMEQLSGHRPRTGPRSDRNLQFNEPMMGNRPYNSTNAARPGIGDSIAGEPDGGRRTAGQIANYLNGFTEINTITSTAGQEFARVVNFSERARGYDQEVDALPTQLAEIHRLRHSGDARANWRNVQGWFRPAQRGYASEAYVPASELPPPGQTIAGPRRQQTTAARPYYNVVEAAPRSRDDRSRSPRESSSRRRSRYGFQSPPAVATAPATETTPLALAQQFAALTGDPQAQARLLDTVRDQLSRTVTLTDGSTLPVLAANVHGTTANTDADLQALNEADRGYLQQINSTRDVANQNDCVPLTLTVDAYKSSGLISQVPPQTRPMSLSEVTRRYPGRTVDEVGTIRGLMDAVGALPNGATGIVGLRSGGPGSVGHVINVAKDQQGRVVFEDAQVPGLATLPAIGPDGSVVLIRTNDPDVEMTSDFDSDIEMGSFSDVAAEAVAKTTDETPTVGDPIDVTTGRMILTHTDAVLPGLTLERTYRSDYRWGRSFGRSWASTLDQRIVVDGDQVRYLAADGSLLSYPLPAEGDEALPLTGRALPLRRLAGGWLLTDPATGRSLLFAAATGTEALLSDVTDAGVRWSVERDHRGTPAVLRSSTGATVAFGSSSGLVTTVSLPNAAGDLMVAAQFAYDDGLHLVEVTNSSGDPERFTYADGRIVRWEDRNGEWYTYSYDEAGRCVGTDGRGGYLRYRFEYQPGRTVVTDSLGAVRTYELNEKFQLVAETDPLGATTRNVWDEAYRLRSTTDALGRTTTHEYDKDGRPTTVVRPDGSRSTIAYDAIGRAVSWTDFDGSTRNRQFDADGLMIAEVDATGEVVRFEQAVADGAGTAMHVGPTAVVRNPARQVTSVTTGVGETSYTYDALGRIFSIEDDRGLTEFGWTLEGELAWRADPDGGFEEFVHDGEGNLVESVDATGRRTFREYGAFDLVTAEIDEDGNRTEYAYDTELRLVTITNPAGATWQYAYDPNGRMVSETDFGGRTQRYAYDAAGQLVAHTSAAGEVTTFTYDLLGRVVERRTGEAVTRFAYDEAGRVAAARDGDSEIILQRDAAGRVVAETVNGNTVATTYSDQLGAVTARIRPSGAVTQWSYDESGRPAVLTAGGQQVPFSLDVAVQPLPTGDVRYTHDSAGRPVTRTDATGEWVFVWDHADRLTEVVTPGGDQWHYRYDAFGRRIAKQRLGAEGGMLEETVFVWSADLLVEQHHRTRAGVTATAWEYHPAAAHPVAQVTDGTLQTDPDAVPLRAGGRYHDPETGLQYDRSRYFDPAAGRFLR